MIATYTIDVIGVNKKFLEHVKKMKLFYYVRETHPLSPADGIENMTVYEYPLNSFNGYVGMYYYVREKNKWY